MEWMFYSPALGYSCDIVRSTDQNMMMILFGVYNCNGFLRQVKKASWGIRGLSDQNINFHSWLDFASHPLPI